jgi:hypothetical protein
MPGRVNLPQGTRIPPELQECLEVNLDDDLELFQLTIRGDFSGQRSWGLTIEEARISQATFVGADLRHIRLTDVRVEGADFSGADMEEASISRVEFVDCRMSGTVMSRAKLHDVSFRDCKLDGANLRMSEAERTVFDHVNLRDAEFSAGRFPGARFFDCDLTGAEFSQAVVPGARFHGSVLADIKGGEHLKNIVVDSSQVLQLALRVFAALGIEVNDERNVPDP